MTSPDPSRTIASLARDQVNLDLKTVDLCFLAGLYLRADKAALAFFEEDMLVDMFEQVCDVFEPGADNPRKRATHAIQLLGVVGKSKPRIDAPCSGTSSFVYVNLVGSRQK